MTRGAIGIMKLMMQICMWQTGEKWLKNLYCVLCILMEKHELRCAHGLEGPSLDFLKMFFFSTADLVAGEFRDFL